MGDTVTLNVVNKNQQQARKFTIQVEDKNFINSIVTVKDNNTITESDVQKLQQVAQRSGDYGIIEGSDLNGEEKLNLANNFKFNEYYDIKLSADKKYFQITIKKTPWYCSDPTLGVIKSDFGIRDNVLVKKGSIPYDNAGVIPASSHGAGYDNIKIPAGKTINVPVSEINIDSTPHGAVYRFFSNMN